MGVSETEHNPTSVANWLRFLFKNHAEFIRMQQNGQLQLSEQALVLQSKSQLGEVLDDVKYESSDDEDEENHTSCNRAGRNTTSSTVQIHQADLESGFSRSDVFTFDKFPHLYLEARDFLKIKQSGQIDVIEDRQR